MMMMMMMMMMLCIDIWMIKMFQSGRSVDKFSLRWSTKNYRKHFLKVYSS